MLRNIFKACVTMLLLFAYGAACAADCGKLANWLDLCEAAKEAGRDAAKELAVGMQNSADIAYSAINFWPWLIQKYHTGTPEEQKKARELVSKVFGTDTIEQAKPFEITVEFEGLDTTKDKLDFVLLRDYTQPNLKTKILNANTADFNIMSLKGVVPAARDDYQDYISDVAKVRERVAKTVQELVIKGTVGYEGVSLDTRTRAKGSPTACKDITDAGGEQNVQGVAIMGGTFVYKCKANAEWKAANAALHKLTDAIMLTVDSKIDKLANRLRITFAYEGYKYLTLVFPKEQLDKQPNLRVLFRVHLKDQPDKPIPIFAGNKWSVVQATIANPAAVYESNRKEHSGKYYAYPINLGLSY